MADSCCNVCIEDYNRSNHKKILCNSCDYVACRSCVEHYITTNSTDIHCMSCRKEWNREHVSNIFTKTFCDGIYKKHRENILFDRERSLLPATQPAAERYLQVKQITTEINKLEKEIITIQSKYIDLSLSVDRNSYEGSLKYLELGYECNLELVPVKYRSTFLQGKKTLLQGTKKSELTERREFIKACPSNNCRGFLSSSWKCGLCEMWACPECHEIKGNTRDTDHVCNPDVLATVRMMQNDSRQCPKCPAVIFKIEGCDQMYCTQCHTAFSWRTGRIETGNIHNPHYYEYMRQRNGGVVPRNPGDIPCGGLIRDRTLRNTINESGLLLQSDIASTVLNYHRIHVHIQEVELQKYVVNRTATNEDLRIKFLVNEIDEKHFKLELQKREKASEKKQEIHNILTMYQTVVMDIINRFTHALPLEQFERAISELNTIRDYTNNSFIKISTLYNCVVPHIVFETIQPRTNGQRDVRFLIGQGIRPSNTEQSVLMYKTKKY